MSFESHVLEAETKAGPERIPDNDEKTRFSMSESSAVENSVANQIRAYAEHVRKEAERTGKTEKEIVAEEREGIKKSGGIANFLKNK
jgi:hypothetical protein